MYTLKYVVLLVIIGTSYTTADYWKKREDFIRRDDSNTIGAQINLQTKESTANSILMKYKIQEIDKGVENLNEYLPAKHFFQAREGIEKSDVFKILKMLPKGASLHSHEYSLLSTQRLYNLTFEFSENLYVCTQNQRLFLNFFGNATDNICNWISIEEIRQKNDTFNDELRSQMTLITDDPEKSYPTINDAWSSFNSIFNTLQGFLTYRPVFNAYMYNVFKEIYDDNIFYAEIRATMSNLYELNGTVYNADQVTGMFSDIIDRFKKDFPDFYGVRLIYAPMRGVNSQTADDYVKTALLLKKKYSNIIAGFDLVGQEDSGKPLSAFVNELEELSGKIKFFFHAGETNWEGMTDLNLIDAVLLNTTRIGHGYAVLKHPEVLNEVKRKQIALEISPISNQVLKLVADLRNHPGSILISQNYPVVICSDDPSFWGAKGLSYDWYYAFMAMTSRNTDLRFLKQLAINSIRYSAMGVLEKIIVLNNWRLEWDRFIENVINYQNTSLYYT